MQNNSSPPRIELLAPAGSTDAFHAALDAGANAVYLGSSAFNARLRARNFSLRSLAFLVPYAHSRNVKVYLTLNTLVKQQELAPAITLLHQAQQIGIDAVIVQDLGIARIMREHFPGLALHASTQMALHNSAGVAAAEKLGARRVILSRELSLDEIRLIKRRSRIEVEVFVHGALCYSVSGACLASSWIGGASGNRGCCTQVCRRKFSGGPEAGHYFSCRDLSAIHLVPHFIEAGVESLKIEGRMKSAEYIHTVVSAYRRAIDNPDDIPRLAETLRYDLSRAKTALFFEGVRQEGIIDADGGPGTGIPLGTVLSQSGDSITLATEERIGAGDYIRIQPADGFEGRNFKVRSVSAKGSPRRFCLADGAQARVGDTAYWTSRKSAADAVRGERKVTTTPAHYSERFARAGEIGAAYSCRPHGRPPMADGLYLKIDNPAWFPLLEKQTCRAVIASCQYDDMRRMAVNDRIIGPWAGRLIAGLPLFIAEEEMAQWQELVTMFRQRGVDRFCASNLGHRRIIGTGGEVIADYPLWALNRAAQSALVDLLGHAVCSYSIEDDVLNLRTIIAPAGMMTVFCRPPLFISRIRPGVGTGAELTDANGNRFITAERNGLFYLLAREPFCLFGKRAKLQQMGITRFVIDLSFFPPERALLDEIMQCWLEGRRYPGGSLGNFKRGLK
jgi:putative protease